MKNVTKSAGLIAFVIIIAVLAACGTDHASQEQGASGSGEQSGSETEPVKLVVGAVPTPHAIILEEAKPILKEKGIELEIKEFQDYIMPNKALKTGDLDANYYQHLPYLEQQKEEFGYEFVNVGKIHVEPMGGYSQKYDSIDELPDGALVLMSSSVSDQSRILTLLDQKGVIQLNEETDYSASFEDIVKNPKNLEFKYDIEPALMTKAYENGEGDLVFINTNYAIDAGLNPLEDSMILEGKDSPYANLVVVREEDQDNEAIQTLVDVLQSKEIQTFIKEKWNGKIVPVALENK